MKKILTYLLAIIIAFSVAVLGGCGAFFEAETVEIASITTKTLENGDTEITIAYVDNVRDAEVFVIPKGDIGLTGNGIEKIDADYDTLREEDKVIITVTTTDGETYPFEVNNGVGIVGVSDTEIETATGQAYFRLKFSNGEQSEPIFIPKGEDGVGIAGIELKLNDDESVFVNDNGNYVMIVTYTDTDEEGNARTVEIELPNGKDGEDGVGIDLNNPPYGTYENNEEGVRTYYIIFNYTDGNAGRIEVPIPSPNTWHSGYGKPSNSTGINGDFYYDLDTNQIWYKKNNNWGSAPIVDIPSVTETCYVRFNLNAEGDESAKFDAGTDDYYDGITKGDYFETAESGRKIPTPSRDGYTFAGWYTSSNDYGVNSAQFTTLTPVMGNLELYARWIKNN